MEKISKALSKNALWIVVGVVAIAVVAYFYSSQRREGFQTAANSESPVTGDATPYLPPEIPADIKEKTCKSVLEYLEQYKKYKEEGKPVNGLDSAIENFTNFKEHYKC